MVSTKEFSSDQTNESFEIRHLLNCRSKNCIYLGFCLKCPYHQYVGKSEPPAHMRFNTHRHDVKSPKGLAFDKHFNEPGHDFDHYAWFILIEQVKQHHSLTAAENRRILEDREDFWMVKLKTLTPWAIMIDLTLRNAPESTLSAASHSPSRGPNRSPNNDTHL